MRSFFRKPRGVITGVVLVAPLALSFACSDSPSTFFDVPMGSGGKGGSSSGGNAGSTGGVASTGGTSGGKAGTGGSNAGNGGSSGSSGGTAGTDASGGMPNAGTAGAGATAGNGGADPGVGGSAGTDALGGEGGMGEGGMDGGAAGTAGTGGIAGTAGTAGQGDGGSTMGGTSGTAGTGGISGGNGGTSGTAGTSSGGTGGASCTPSTEICDGLDNDCGDDIDEDDVCPSGCHGGTLKGRTFLLCTSDEELEWSEARTFCRGVADAGGDVEVAGPMTLVQIESAEENEFLVDWIEDLEIEDDVWFGANDRTAEGQWVWDRGSDSAVLFFRVSPTRMAVDGAYHNWPTGQPTYAVSAVDCGIFDASDDFDWDDRTCTQPLASFICGEIP